MCEVVWVYRAVHSMNIEHIELVSSLNYTTGSASIFLSYKPKMIDSPMMNRLPFDSVSLDKFFLQLFDWDLLLKIKITIMRK